MARFSVRLAAAIAALLMLGLGTPTHAQTAPAPAPTALPTGYLPVGTWQLMAEVNKHRRARGLPALAVDPGLAKTARAWSERMAVTRRLAHNDSLFSTASRQRLGMAMLGENVGYNFSVMAQHKALLASPGHRRNLEHSGFRSAGFAVVRDTRGHLWTTQVFGTRRG